MPISNFTARLGRDIIRIAPDGRKTRFEITTYQVAEYLHSLQAHGYKFEVVPTIHNRLESCESCSS